VSNGDYSFDAKHDGKFTYCFGNEHWGANSKEVSFNVHGIVYVAEHEAEKDPLEAEGRFHVAYLRSCHLHHVSGRIKEYPMRYGIR
jgi:hypothetical protein